MKADTEIYILLGCYLTNIINTSENGLVYEMVLRSLVCYMYIYIVLGACSRGEMSNLYCARERRHWIPHMERS